MERFDLVEYRAARTIQEADFFWKHRLSRIPASRLNLPPRGVLPRIRRVIDSFFLKEAAL
jgi:hypothetical protein